jgi:uncharacterized protein involved in type VI secretion and phage assembly
MNRLGDDLGRIRNALDGRYYGLYPAVVTRIVDPENRARVQVRLPWSPDRKADHYEVWARLATLMAGDRRGTWFVPDVNDEVLVAFEAGDPRQPFVVGALWNGKDTPPEQMDQAGRNDCKTIRSREGVRITWQDTAGAAQLLLETPAGQRITLGGAGGVVLVEDSRGNSITLDSSGITITAAAQVSVKAGQVEVSAGAVTVNTGMAKFSGVVQCDTLIANAVIASSYSPGAGNIS